MEARLDIGQSRCWWCLGPAKTLLLTHLPLVLHICVGELGQHWFRQWFVACSAPSHYLNQCWLIVNWTLRNKIQWNLNQNTKLFIHENAFENDFCEMEAIFSRGRWLKNSWFQNISSHNTDPVAITKRLLFMKTYFRYKVDFKKLNY